MGANAQPTAITARSWSANRAARELANSSIRHLGGVVPPECNWTHTATKGATFFANRLRATCSRRLIVPSGAWNSSLISAKD